MASLNRSIDRSIDISRAVSDVLSAACARRASTTSSACAQAPPRRPAGAGDAADAARGDAAVAGVHDRPRAAQRAVLGHAAPARQQLARARGRRQAAGARLRVRDASPTRAASSARPTTRWCASSRRRACDVDDADAPVRDHRSARGPRSRHRRLQGGFRGRRRAARRATRCTSSSSIRIRCPARRWPTSCDAEAEFIRIVAERHPRSAEAR